MLVIFRGQTVNFFFLFLFLSRLHGNPWNCACEKGLKDLLNSKPKISLGAEPVLCVTPDKFKDAKIQINKKCGKIAMREL